MTDERASLCAVVHIVTYGDYDSHFIASAWSTLEAANAEVERLNTKNMTSGFSAESVTLDVVDGAGNE